MSSRLAIFAGGVIAGIFIDQSYNLPNISKVGTSLGKTIAKKVQELEKREEKNGENKTDKNKIEKGNFWGKK